MRPPAPSPEPDRAPRREWAVVLALTALGAVLRSWRYADLGLVHFDEGIYALGGFWIESPRGLLGLRPETIAYAPPLYPILVGLAYLLLGPGDHAAILPALVAGVATIPAVGWLGRRTFGPGAGAASAALVALAGPHVAFSRMALTDSTFLLAWVLAIGLGMRFLERPGFLRAMAFGLAVGLAQNAKYNGILAGVSVASAILPALVRPDRRTLALIGWGVLAMGVALLTYVPWFRFVESHGGYAALIRHHRSYLHGLDRWPGHWQVQMAQAVALSGQIWGRLGLGVIAWPVAWLAASFARNGWRPARERGGVWAAGLLVGAITLGTLPNAPWFLALAAVPALLRDGRPAVRVVGGWWLLLACLTPFYHPYARLMLPLQTAGLLVAAGIAARLIPGQVVADGATPAGSTSTPSPFGWRSILGGLALALGFMLLTFPAARPWPGLLRESSGLRRGTDRLIADLARLQPRPNALRVLARPPTVFYLAVGSEIPLARVPDAESLLGADPPGAWAVVEAGLVSGPGEDDDFWSRSRSRWRVVRAYPFPTNLPTRLDEAPQEALGVEPTQGDQAEAPGRLILLRPLR